MAFKKKSIQGYMITLKKRVKRRRFLMTKALKNLLYDYKPIILIKVFLIPK